MLRISLDVGDVRLTTRSITWLSPTSCKLLSARLPTGLADISRRPVSHDHSQLGSD